MNVTKIRIFDSILEEKANEEFIKNSDASQAQAESMKQIENGINQISVVVQSNSETAQETSATSEELAAQSENLKSLVDTFSLRQ